MTENVVSAEEVLKKIKSRGYWFVDIRPLQFKKERIKSLKECKELVKDCVVFLRGWDYPHYSRRYEPISGLDWIESVIDWQEYKEIWRMYQSGQFVNFFGCKEDWLSETKTLFGTPRTWKYAPGLALSVLNTLFRITEIYEFASRLANKKIFEEGLYLNIELHGMKNRGLIVLDPIRILLHVRVREYKCGIDDLPHASTISIENILGKAHDLALDHTIWIFERFNWDSPPRKMLKEDQKRFLERRL